MFVSGFTFIKNAISLDYPIEQAIRSILSLVDEVVVAVGNSEDDTRARVEAISEKVRIIDTEWNMDLKDGTVLADETNKALEAIDPNATWCVYIQADECLHEGDYDEIRTAMQTYEKVDAVEGLLFNYKHFYGSYDYVANGRSWYRKEIRVIKNIPGLHSWKDAQGFRIQSRKIKVVELEASIYHYGWVRHPKFQMAKQIAAHKLWHSEQYVKEKFDVSSEFDYSNIDSIERFKGSHPEVMRERIEAINWKFDRDPEVKNLNLKSRLLLWIEMLTGKQPFAHQNYIVVRK